MHLESPPSLCLMFPTYPGPSLPSSGPAQTPSYQTVLRSIGFVLDSGLPGRNKSGPTTLFQAARVTLSLVCWYET